MKGDNSVGKTNIITKFTLGEFNKNYVATQKYDYKYKNLTISED